MILAYRHILGGISKHVKVRRGSEAIHYSLLGLHMWKAKLRGWGDRELLCPGGSASLYKGPKAQDKGRQRKLVSRGNSFPPNS